MSEGRLGHYVLLRRLGAGAMGEVWLAEHELLRVRRALKVLPERLSASGGFRRRFLEEGRVLASLRHPHIVAVHDMGIAGDIHHIAMDFVSPDGESSQSLDDLLRARGGRLAPAEALAIMRQVCDAVGHAHAHGVIHRDLKPSNILMDRGGAVRVSDFGLAKVVGEEFMRSSIAASLSGSLGAQPSVAGGLGAWPGGGGGSSLGADPTRVAPDVSADVSSGSRSLVGTYNYMPPEVQEGGEWTARGDVYSLGCVGYVMLTGVRPVGRFRLPSQLRGDVPTWWDAVLARALEPDPQDRWPSVEALLGALEDEGGVPCPPPVGGGGARMGALLVLLVVVAAAAAGYYALGLPGSQRLRPLLGFSAGGSAVSSASDAPAPTAAPEPTATATPTPDTSELDALARQAAESARQAAESARLLESAKAAYAKAEGIDASTGVSVADKLKAWELALAACSGASHRVGEIESRIAHWKRETSLAPYTEDAGVGLGLEMLWVEGGTFLMGSPAGEVGRDSDEGPQREVLLDGFWLGKHEVTRGQFGRFVEARGYRTDAETGGKSWGVTSDGSASEQSGLSWRSAGFEQSDLHPVVHVSWTDAVAFCDWLSGVSGRRYVLPSEAQWEYGCRAGSVSAFAWGADAAGGRGWLNGGDASAKRVYGGDWPAFPFDDGYVYTSPVGQFRSNAWGLHDMHGNVWEWCRDWYGADFYGSSASRVRNPENTTEGSLRACRGGGWYGTPRICRSAFRGRDSPGRSFDILGFRVLAVRSGIQ